MTLAAMKFGNGLYPGRFMNSCRRFSCEISAAAALAWTIVLFASVGAAQAVQTPAELTIETQSGQPPVLQAEINGHPVRLLLAPDGPRFILLNPDAADRLGLRSNPMLSLGVRLDIQGDVTRGRTGRARVRPESGRAFRQRIVWFEGVDVARDADGVIGAASFQQIDRLTIVIHDADRAAHAPMTVARFNGRRGLEWVAQARAAGLPLEVSLSFSRPSSLDRAASFALETRDLIAPAGEHLVFAPFWFIDQALAFDHRVTGFELQGLSPNRFLRFAQIEEVEAHHAMLDYERRFGPIDRITVRAAGSRRPDDPYRATLGDDLLLRCWRIEFDYVTDQIVVRCPDLSELSTATP